MMSSWRAALPRMAGWGLGMEVPGEAGSLCPSHSSGGRACQAATDAKCSFTHEARRKEPEVQLKKLDFFLL